MICGSTKKFLGNYRGLPLETAIVSALGQGLRGHIRWERDILVTRPSRMGSEMVRQVGSLESHWMILRIFIFILLSSLFPTTTWWRERDHNLPYSPIRKISIYIVTVSLSVCYHSCMLWTNPLVVLSLLV